MQVILACRLSAQGWSCGTWSWRALKVCRRRRTGSACRADSAAGSRGRKTDLRRPIACCRSRRRTESPSVDCRQRSRTALHHHHHHRQHQLYQFHHSSRHMTRFDIRERTTTAIVATVESSQNFVSADFWGLFKNIRCKFYFVKTKRIQKLLNLFQYLVSNTWRTDRKSRSYLGPLFVMPPPP